MKNENRCKGHSQKESLADGRHRLFNMSNGVSGKIFTGGELGYREQGGIARLCTMIFTRLYEELVPFETGNSAPLNGGYSSSSHSGRVLNLVLEEYYE